MIRVMIVEDQLLMLDMLVSVINKESDMQLVATSDHGLGLADMVGECKPDVLVLDLSMEDGFEPISTVRNLTGQFPRLYILAFTNHDDDAWVRVMLDAGVTGYMLKTGPFSRNLGDAVRSTSVGERFLSPRIAGAVIDYDTAKIKLTPVEISILMLFEKGESMDAVASQQTLSEKRIQSILDTIYRKLEIKGGPKAAMRILAINKARALGLLPEKDALPA